MNSEMQLERMEAQGIHNLLEDDIHTDLILSLLSSVHGMRVRHMCLRDGVPGEGELGEKLARGVLHHILHREMDGGLGLRKTQSRYIGGEAIQHVDGSGDNPWGSREG